MLVSSPIVVGISPAKKFTPISSRSIVSAMGVIVSTSRSNDSAKKFRDMMMDSANVVWTNVCRVVERISEYNNRCNNGSNGSLANDVGKRIAGEWTMKAPSKHQTYGDWSSSQFRWGTGRRRGLDSDWEGRRSPSN